MPVFGDRYEMLEECPSLRDQLVLDRNPRILDVAWFMLMTEKALGRPPIYDKVGVNDLDGFVRLVDTNRNFAAFECYVTIREEFVEYFWKNEKKL